MGFHLTPVLGTILKIFVQMHCSYSYWWCMNWQHIFDCIIYVIIFSFVQLFCDVEACCLSVYLPWKLCKIIHEDFDFVKMCADSHMISRALHQDFNITKWIAVTPNNSLLLVSKMLHFCNPSHRPASCVKVHI